MYLMKEVAIKICVYEYEGCTPNILERCLARGNSTMQVRVLRLQRKRFTHIHIMYLTLESVTLLMS